MDKEFCTIYGRKGLIIGFDKDCPEEVLKDKSLVGLSDEELEKALNKPFFTSGELNIRIIYNNSFYNFTIPNNYDWNGANIPPFCWLIIGQPKDPRFKLASCVHDFLCENKSVIDENRYLSTLVFETLCEYFGRFNALKRWAMFHTVDNFQKTQGWKK